MNVDDTVADNDLIETCRQGNEDAFNALYQRYRLPLYAYINRLLPRSRSDADDVFQQTWTKVLQNLHAYRDQQKFLAWMCRIAHNLAVDQQRRQARFVDGDLQQEPAAESSDHAWESMDKQTRLRALQLAIDTLASEQREVLTLRQQGVSFKDIAQIQNTSINTVLGRMHYAIRNLQKHLRDYA